MNTALRKPRLADPTHLYKVGEVVHLRRKFGAVRPEAERFRIVATLPARDGRLQYRIRSDEERHERVTTQDDIEAIAEPTAGSDGGLLGKTFGHC